MGQKDTNREGKSFNVADFLFNNQLPVMVAIALGQIPGVESGNKFGQLLSFDPSDGRLPVNEMNEPYPYQTEAFIPSFASTDAEDANGLTGAWEIIVEGTDAPDGDFQSERIVLNGLTPVASLLSWSAINRMYVDFIGTEETAIGSIYCGLGTWTLGTPSIKLARINDGNNQTQMCQFRVPKGYTCLINSITYTTIAGKPVIFHDELRIKDSPFDFRRPFKNVRTVNVQTDYSFQLDGPASFPEFSDVRITALATQVLSTCEAAFRYMLVKNDWYDRRF